jgi:hypothetical protein
MRATTSHDGRLRFTIQVTHRVGLEEIIAVLYLRFAHLSGSDMQHEQITRTAVEKALRAQLKANPETLYYWRDGISAAHLEDFSEWATIWALRLWPELREEA